MTSAIEIYETLRKGYPDSRISLNYSNPLELLVSVMLSAQCTDKRVNVVTSVLFRRFRTAKDYSDCDIEELKGIIHSAGFYNTKAKHIKEAARMICESYGGVVPDNMDDLLTLPGVARKTANIVLSNAFGKNEGIAVDTHMIRLNRRLGITRHKDPVKIEHDLMKKLPKELWNRYTYVIIEHGRAVCKAPVPICSACILSAKCPMRGVDKKR